MTEAIIAMGDGQSEKFKQAARDLESDEDEARSDERLKKIAKQKPAPENEAEKA